MYTQFFWANQWSKFKACFAIVSIDRMIICAWPAIIVGDYCIKLPLTASFVSIIQPFHSHLFATVTLTFTHASAT